MKNFPFFFIITLAGILLASPSEQAGTKGKKYPEAFSHQLHIIDNDMECTDCHTRVTESLSAYDDNRPDEDVCFSCHEDTLFSNAGPLRLFENPTRIVIFNHNVHVNLDSIGIVLKMAVSSGKYLGIPPDLPAEFDSENACSSCHRGMNKADFSTEDNLPVMSDCLVCHSEVDPPFSCKTCHSSDVRLTPLSHTETWIDDHTEMKHEKPNSCEPCHGRSFTCRGCH